MPRHLEHEKGREVLEEGQNPFDTASGDTASGDTASGDTASGDTAIQRQEPRGGFPVRLSTQSKLKEAYFLSVAIIALISAISCLRRKIS